MCIAPLLVGSLKIHEYRRTVECKSAAIFLRLNRLHFHPEMASLFSSRPSLRLPPRSRASRSMDAVPKMFLLLLFLLYYYERRVAIRQDADQRCQRELSCFRDCGNADWWLHIKGPLSPREKDVRGFRALFRSCLYLSFFWGGGGEGGGGG